MGRPATSILLPQPSTFGAALSLAFETYRWRECGTPQVPVVPRRLSLRAALEIVPERVRISNVALLHLVHGTRSRIKLETYVFLAFLSEALVRNASGLWDGATWNYPNLPAGVQRVVGVQRPRDLLEQQRRDLEHVVRAAYRTRHHNKYALAFRGSYINAVGVAVECFAAIEHPDITAPRRTKTKTPRWRRLVTHR